MFSKCNNYTVSIKKNGIYSKDKKELQRNPEHYSGIILLIIKSVMLIFNSYI